MKNANRLVCTLVVASASYAQGPKPPTTAFQYINIGSLPGARNVAFEGVSSQQVTGKPFAGTEERHSLQVLADGTRIENTDTNRIYRDGQGRTRTERAGGVVVIHDPVEGTMIELNQNDRTVRRMSFRVNYTKVPGSASAEAAALDKMKAEMLQRKAQVQVVDVPKPQAEALALHKMLIIPGAAPSAAGIPETAAESLGTQFVNGVNAEGHRNVIEIPTGQIGNDHPLRVVSERWYSGDLQMLVRTSNSDPRFGETTYQLSDIVQGPQDPSLFQTPPNYIEIK